MREQTCCFTGHRFLPASQIPALEQSLEAAILHLLSQGVCYFGAGGALGFDTLAAQAVLRLREAFPQLRLILILPCRTQADKWRPKQQAEYASILSRADKLVYTSDDYYPGCMHYRNRYLVAHSSHCICYYTHARGGTHYTVNLCKKLGLNVVNLAPPPSPLA